VTVLLRAVLRWAAAAARAGRLATARLPAAGVGRLMAAGRTPGRAAAVPLGVPRPTARVAGRARRLPMARAGLPVLRRTGAARRARLDAMVRVLGERAVRQVRLPAGRAQVTPGAAAPRTMNRAALAGPRSETVRTAAQEADPVVGPGRQRPGLGGMPRTADATTKHLTVTPGVLRPAIRAAGHPARTARRGASALAARKMQIPASTGVGRGRRTASAAARIRTAAAQGPIAAGQELSVPVPVVPVLAGRAGIEPVPVVPVRVVTTLTGTAPTGRRRAAPVRVVPTLTGTAPTGRRRAAPVPTGTAVTARAAVALPTVLTAVGRRRALVTAVVTVRHGRPAAAIVTGRTRGRAAVVPRGARMTGAAEVVPARPTRHVRRGRAFLIRLPPTSSIPRRGPSSTACRTT
jgi:hypothetical protein